jgi:MFS transporter, DHA3 family, macrolide efflux protein
MLYTGGMSPEPTATATTAPTQPTPWKLRFFAIWAGQACSLFGSQLVQFALIWYLAQQTNSATTLAVASLIGLLPQVLLAPLIGAVVDRWDRRAILIVADACVALATLGLALLFALDRIAIWQIYVLLLIRAVGGGFHQSAMGASVVLLVPREQLARVQGLNQSLRGGLDIVAAPLGALLLAWLPMQAILAIDVATAALAIAPLLFFHLPQPARRQAEGRPQSIWADMRDGTRYVLGWPALVIILGMVMVINLMLTPAEALLPLLVTRHFKGDALLLGWFTAAHGSGILAGGLLLGLWGGFGRRIVTAQCGLVGMGAGVLLTGLAPDSMLWLAIAATFITGSMIPITNGSYGAVLQASIAPDMQGRVFALILSVASAISPLSLMLAGPLADAYGVRPWLWVGGATCMAMGVAGFCIPTVMRFGAQPDTAMQPMPLD